MDRFLIFLSIFAIPTICDASGGALEKDVKRMVKVFAKSIPDHAPTLVVPFQGMNGTQTRLGNYLANELTVALARKSKTVLERKAVDSVLEEKRLNDLGLLDQSTVVEIGKLLGAKLAIYGTAIQTKRDIEINIKVVEIEKGVLVDGITHTIKRSHRINALLKKLGDEDQVYEEPRSKISFGGGYLYAKSMNETLFEDGSGGTGIVSYSVTDALGIDVTSGYYTQKIKSGNLIREGEIGVVPLLLGFRYDILTSGFLMPYANFGGGFYFITHQKAKDPNQVANTCPGQGDRVCSDDIDDSMGWYAGGGLKLSLTENIGITGDAKYFKTKAEVGPKALTTKENEIEFSNWLVTIGMLIRYN